MMVGVWRKLSSIKLICGHDSVTIRHIKHEMTTKWSISISSRDLELQLEFRVFMFTILVWGGSKEHAPSNVLLNCNCKRFAKMTFSSFFRSFGRLLLLVVNVSPALVVYEPMLIARLGYRLLGLEKNSLSHSAWLAFPCCCRYSKTPSMPGKISSCCYTGWSRPPGNGESDRYAVKNSNTISGSGLKYFRKIFLNFFQDRKLFFFIGSKLYFKNGIGEDF